MTLLTRQELHNLLNAAEGPCVSIYLPTHRAGREVQQDPIRFKNLLGQAQAALVDAGMRAADARAYLSDGYDLLTDKPFWEHQQDGLAVFIADGFSQTYSLPFRFDELALVTDRFYVKPLLPLLSNDGQFYVLALSQKSVRLLQGTRYSVSEVALEDVPRSLAEVLAPDQLEKHLQFHTGTANRARGRRAVYHGQGDENDFEAEALRRYFRQIDAALPDLIENGAQVPLILAGVAYLLPIYREISRYPLLMAEGVPGNPEDVSVQELHERALEIVQPYFSKEQRDALARYQALRGKTHNGGTAAVAVDVADVVPAAHHARVDTLFTKAGHKVWGAYDVRSNRVEVFPTADDAGADQRADLLNMAAIETLRHGGTVHVLSEDNMPDDGPTAAILRF
jgi:hypothetical protein